MHARKQHSVKPFIVVQSDFKSNGRCRSSAVASGWLACSGKNGNPLSPVPPPPESQGPLAPLPRSPGCNQRQRMTVRLTENQAYRMTKIKSRRSGKNITKSNSTDSFYILRTSILCPSSLPSFPSLPPSPSSSSATTATHEGHHRISD